MQRRENSQEVQKCSTKVLLLLKHMDVWTLVLLASGLLELIWMVTYCCW